MAKKLWLIIAWLLYANLSLAQSLTTSNGEALSYDGYLAVASSYVYRGIQLSKNGVIPQGGILVQHVSGLFLNTHFSQVELSGLFGPSKGDDLELQFDLGYSWQFSRLWAVSASYAWIEYSHRHLDYDYDYREARLTIDYSDYISFIYANTHNFYGFDVKQRHYSLVGRYPFSDSVVGELELGETDFDGLYQSRFTYARLNLGKVYQQWGLQLQYHYSSDNAKDIYRSSRVGSQTLIKLSYHF